MTAQQLNRLAAKSGDPALAGVIGDAYEAAGYPLIAIAARDLLVEGPMPETNFWEWFRLGMEIARFEQDAFEGPSLQSRLFGGEYARLFMSVPSNSTEHDGATK
jgi:hypothetical protein